MSSGSFKYKEFIRGRGHRTSPTRLTLAVHETCYQGEILINYVLQRSQQTDKWHQLELTNYQLATNYMDCAPYLSFKLMRHMQFTHTYAYSKTYCFKLKQIFICCPISYPTLAFRSNSVRQCQARIKQDLFMLLHELTDSLLSSQSNMSAPNSNKPRFIIAAWQADQLLYFRCELIRLCRNAMLHIGNFDLSKSGILLAVTSTKMCLPKNITATTIMRLIKWITGVSKSKRTLCRVRNTSSTRGSVAV